MVSPGLAELMADWIRSPVLTAMEALAHSESTKRIIIAKVTAAKADWFIFTASIRDFPLLRLYKMPFLFIVQQGDF
jgi:hypothetical protein